MFADLFDSFILLFVKDDFILFKQVSPVSIN